MQLFQIPPPPADLVCTPEQEALAARDTLLATATSIQAVRSPEDNQQCSVVGSEMQKLVKGVESARKDLTAPYLAAQRSIKATADAFCEPLLKALARLGNLASAYRQEQERKAEAERQARAAEIARLQQAEWKAAEGARKLAESSDLAGSIMGDLIAAAAGNATRVAIAVPVPEAPKTAGQSFQDRVLGWECTDPELLWQ